MLDYFLLAAGGFLLGYAVKACQVREQEKELSMGMQEVARLTARLNQTTKETEQLYEGKARLN